MAKIRRLMTPQSRADLIAGFAALVAATPPPPAAKTPPAPPTAKPDNSDANPVDENGNVDPHAVCANPDCGHMAASHDNQDAGENTGPCGMQVCECAAFEVDHDPDGDDDSGGDGEAPPADPAKGTGDMSLASGDPVPVAPAGTSSVPGAGEEPTAPPVAGGENMGPAFTIPVAVIEGQPTGDGRSIAIGALTWRDPPMALMLLTTNPHDPSGYSENDPAVMCGRIDGLTRTESGGTATISAHGFFLPNEEGQYAADLVEAMGRVGVSADIQPQAEEYVVTDQDESGFPTAMDATITEGVILGLTICPFPAFAGAYVVLGDGTTAPDAQPIPQQVSEDSGLTASDHAPEAVMQGGQLIHLLTDAECEICADPDATLVASGGPTRPPASWFADPGFTEGDGRLQEIHSRQGTQLACPHTVTEDGRVFGHLAAWGTCHIGRPGCVTAPHSPTNYAYFKRGQTLITAEGDTIRVGALTMDLPHASLDRRTTATAAMAHYDDTSAVVADVNVGEDDYGIWYAGAMRPSVEPERVSRFRAASLSGDWRTLGGKYDLVAALAVPVPGFPHAVVADGHAALVAAGQQVMHALAHANEVSPVEASVRAMLEPFAGDVIARAGEHIAALTQP